MAKSIDELLDSLDTQPKQPTQEQAVVPTKAKTTDELLDALEGISKPTQAAVIEQPQQAVNIDAYNPMSLFGKIAPTAPKEPPPQEPPKLVQGGRQGEINDEAKATNLAFDVLRNKYPIASSSYLLQLTNNMGGVDLKNASPELNQVVKDGLRRSIMGTRARALGYGEAPSLTQQQYDSMSIPTKFIHDFATFLGDIPSGVVGGAMGAAAGPLGFFGGFMGMNEGLRTYYDSLIEKGEVKSPLDFLLRANEVAKNEVKGMAVGKATQVAGAFAGLPAEILTMPTVGAALEARLPKAQDYYDTATFLLGMNMITKGPATIGKMRELFRKTGMTPKDVLEDVKADPTLKQVLIDDSTVIPEEVLAKAKAKVDEANKIQEDLAAAAKVAKNPPTAEDIVKEELKTKAKKVKEIRRIDVQDLIKEGKVRVIQEGTKSVQQLNGLNESEVDTYYHKTTTKNAEAILKEGFKAKPILDILNETIKEVGADKNKTADYIAHLDENYSSKEPGHVYLAKDKKIAELYPTMEAVQAVIEAIQSNTKDSKVLNRLDRKLKEVLKDTKRTDIIEVELPRNITKGYDEVSFKPEVINEHYKKAEPIKSATELLEPAKPKVIVRKGGKKEEVSEGVSITLYRGRAKEDAGKVQGEAQFYTTSKARAQEFADTNIEGGLTPEVIERKVTLKKIAREEDILRAGEEEGKYQKGDKFIEEEPIDLLDEPEVVSNLIKKGFDGVATLEHRVGMENQSKIKNTFVALLKKPYEEPITDLDLQIGTPMPKELSPTEHPFRDKDVKHTNEMSKLFVDRIKSRDIDPEVFTRYMINEVNRWLNGEEPATPIEKLRNGLSNAAVNAENARSKFDTTKDFETWKDTVSEAARWARESDRLIVKPTGRTQLNMMIPINEVPERVKQFINTGKGIIDKITGKADMSKIYRNKELLDKTGFWAGKDGKWRYEIDDRDIRIDTKGLQQAPLESIITAPSLFKAVPELKGIDFILDRYLGPNKGEYRTATPILKGAIAVKSTERSTIIHELQHAVNDIVGSRFRGSNKAVEQAKIDKDIFTRLRNAAKTDEVKALLDKAAAEYDYRNRNNLEVSMHDMLDASKDPAESNAIAGALRDYTKANAFENYMKDPGEMEARLASERMDMTPEQRKATPPWETLENMLGVEFGMAERDVKASHTLYSGLDPTEATRQIIKGAKDFMAYMDKARGMKVFKPGEAFKQVREEIVRSGIDRSGNIRKSLLDQLGEQGYGIVQKMVLTKGASSLAAQNLKQMQSEVYAGLSSKEKRILDGLILADRMSDIASYKNNFKFPEGISENGKVPDKTIKYRTLFQNLEGLTDAQAATLNKRAQAYFEWMKKPLKDLLDAELISQGEYDLLASHNYRRLKLVDIFDKSYQTKLGKKVRTVYDSGVEALAHGRDTDIFEPSSEVMALEVFNRAYGRIFNNAANKTLLELARTNKDNPFVATKDSPKDRIPSGWDRVYVFEKGERKALYLSPEVSREWITQSPEMSYKMSQFLRYVSGSAVLRTFATGIDWGFALANLPRDIMHIWYASRVLEPTKNIPISTGVDLSSGKAIATQSNVKQVSEWKPLYSSTMPVYAGQMAADIGTVFSDAMLRGKKYQDYIKEGGGMEFLVHQGRLLQRGRHVEGGLDHVMNFLGYLGETSEIMTRLAIRDRVIKRRAAEQGLSYEEAAKDKKITQEATFAARDYMDFGQGGSIAKGLDNAMPYLNASIQGTRGLFRALTQNKWESSYKLAQFTALVTGLYIANQNFNPETSKALKGSLDTQGNLIVPLGDGFGFDDEKGQRHYPYIKIPLDPGQKFFKTFIEGATDKMLGNEVDVKGITNSLSQVSPVAISSLPPTIGAVLGYYQNKDSWNNTEIWRKTDKALEFPKSGEEFIPGETPQALIDLFTVEVDTPEGPRRRGLSPERLKYALSELFTGGSVWGWLVGQGYDAAFHGLESEKKEQHLAMILSKTPMIKRFFGVTNPYTQFQQLLEDAQSEAMLKRWVENRELDKVAQGYLFDNVGNENDVHDYIRQYRDSDTRDRLKERWKFQKDTRDLSNRSFWLSLKSITDTEARAKVYADRLEKANSKEYGELMEEKRTVQKAGGVFSDEFNRAVSKIRAGVE